MITEPEYRAKMYWLANRMQNGAKYRDMHGVDRTRMEIQGWGTKGFDDGLGELASGIDTAIHRMQIANYIYRLYMPNEMHSQDPRH